ncbi:MAG: hypothetical protein HY696_06545 [Deltaproteobacteria bacterium]|nr:hypothetical protein [Deltaproteobacteria bacterium]
MRIDIAAGRWAAAESLLRALDRQMTQARRFYLPAVAWYAVVLLHETELDALSTLTQQPAWPDLPARFRAAIGTAAGAADAARRSLDPIYAALRADARELEQILFVGLAAKRARARGAIVRNLGWRIERPT